MALGHPKGLFPLFFTEMWERLAFYTMLGILLLYTTDIERGGLGLPAADGNEIYGLYLAFVYFTPFLGGMIADRFLGYRKAVFLGGLLMAGGLFLMGTPGFAPFTTGLILLIVGNGFFKPNISVMVGNLYEPGDTKRDAGFNIFYMGINIGAFVANLLAASVRNELGWLWTFRVAGFGICAGLLVLLFNWKVLERADRQPERDPEDTSFGTILFKILLPAFGVGVLGYIMALKYLGADFAVRPAVCGFLAGMIPVIIFFVRLGLTAREDERPGLLALLPIYVAGGTFFMILHLNGSAMTQWARDNTDRQASVVPAAMKQEALPLYYVNAKPETPRPDPRSLMVVDDFLAAPVLGPTTPPEELASEGAMAADEGTAPAEAETAPAEAGTMPAETAAEERAPEVPPLPQVEAVTVARMYGQQRMDGAVVDYLKATMHNGIRVVDVDESSPAQWEARAVQVYKPGVVNVVTTTDSHGAPTTTVEVPDGADPVGQVAFVRDVEGREIATYLVDRETYDKVYEAYKEKYGHEPEYLPPGEYLPVANSELYQSFNPLFVIAFTPLVVAFFQFLVSRGKGITTARKVFIGLLLTTGSLLLMSIAGVLSQNGHLKVSAIWLIGFYAIVTLGELCLSPMGLSLVTKLSPKRLVGLTMGGWFMATAFGNNFSGFFGGIQHMMSPASFFLVLAGLAGLAALFIFLLLPKLDAAIQKYGA